MDDANQEAKSLEMRIAAIEDKLSKISVTEDELRTYQKVASLVARNSACIAASSTQSIVGTGTCIRSIISIPISIPITSITPPIIVNDCIQFAASGAAGSTGFQALGQ